MGIAPFPFRAFDHSTPAAEFVRTPFLRPRRCGALLLAAALLLAGLPGRAPAQSLRGSRASLDRQVAQARQHDFTHLANARQLRRFVDAGYLVPVSGNADYTLFDVSFPFARPAVRLFVERLSAQYRRACGERLVVTSLTRPRSHQPHNASDRSVHPTGMAVDLRRPAGRCRAWLESVLLSLEARGLVEATSERRPPHYHVAVYPAPYADYVARQTAGVARQTAGGGGGESAVPAAIAFHVVRRGDTLGRIARRYGAAIDALRRANDLTSSLIHPGQTLRVPGVRASSAGGVGAPESSSSSSAAAAPASRVASSAPVVHVVRRGDTLTGIARRHGSSVAALRRANGLSSSLIRAGQTLRVPGARSSSGAVGGAGAPSSAAAAPRAVSSSRVASSSSAPTVHVVRRGDTLTGIARRHGTSVAALRRTNGLSSSLIRAGQTLRVPGAGSSSGAVGGAGAASSSASASHAAPASRVASSSSESVVHVVRRGDTLTGIARRHGTSVAALRRTNGLSSSLIRAGQTLRVPGAGSSSGGSGAAEPASSASASSSRVASSSSAPVVHVVRRGDTLTGIARRHGSSVVALRRENGLRSSLIRAGQTLRVPPARP